MRYDDLPFFPAGEAGRATRVWIEPSGCIGCVRCLQICPVDAIIGMRHRMHTVIADWCTGCLRCVAPCPTSCIVPEPGPATAHDASVALRPAEPPPDLDAAFARYEQRQRRLALDPGPRRLAARDASAPPRPRQDIIAAALERARARIAQRARRDESR